MVLVSLSMKTCFHVFVPPLGKYSTGNRGPSQDRRLVVVKDRCAGPDLSKGHFHAPREECWTAQRNSRDPRPDPTFGVTHVAGGEIWSFFIVGELPHSTRYLYITNMYSKATGARNNRVLYDCRVAVTSPRCDQAGLSYSGDVP